MKKFHRGVDPRGVSSVPETRAAYSCDLPQVFMFLRDFWGLVHLWSPVQANPHTIVWSMLGHGAFASASTLLCIDSSFLAPSLYGRESQNSSRNPDYNLQLQSNYNLQRTVSGLVSFTGLFNVSIFLI